jgi:anti-sigma factor ChrR (cupin superfamily)
MTLLPSCREVQIDLTEYAEGTLPRSRRIGIWIHLFMCKACAGFLRGMRALPGLVKQALAPQAAAPEAATKALAEIQESLKGKGL